MLESVLILEVGSMFCHELQHLKALGFVFCTGREVDGGLLAVVGDLWFVDDVKIHRLVFL